MKRKPITEGGKREEIIKTALSLFLENGYESTSIRMISGKAGCEVGLVYYYFKTKDDIFEKALSLYFTKAEQDFTSLAEKSVASTEKILALFVDTVEKKAEDIKKSFSDSVHWTIRFAICERITQIEEKALGEILTNMLKKDMNTSAAFIARGICGAALSESFDFDKDELLRIANGILGKGGATYNKKRDIPSFLL